MISEKLKQENRKIVFKFIIYLSIIIISLTMILLLFQELAGESIALFAFFSLIVVIIFATRLSGNLRKFYNYRYKVVTLENKIPYPRSFTRGLPIILLDGKKAYTYKKKIVPSCFIEFQEGKVSYLVKELKVPHENNDYKLLYLYDNEFALVADINERRYLTNINNLEVFEQI